MLFSPEEKVAIDKNYAILSEKADMLYEFVMLYNNYIHTAHDYGTGELISMVEVHTLTMIEENPGITVSELAKRWNRTKSAVSQNVSKLETKGHVRRERSDENSKTIHLYPTEKGLTLSTAHKKYDCSDILKTRDELLKTCDEHELEVFYKVIKRYIELF